MIQSWVGKDTVVSLLAVGYTAKSRTATTDERQMQKTFIIITTTTPSRAGKTQEQKTEGKEQGPHPALVPRLLHDHIFHFTWT